MAKRFFILGNTPSSKNNRIATQHGAVIASPATQKWRRTTAKAFETMAEEFQGELVGLTLPYFIEFTFARDSRRIFDYHNIVQAPLDAMVRYGWIPDDNMKTIKPYFGDYIVDKRKPGVYIKVLKNKPIHDIQT